VVTFAAPAADNQSVWWLWGVGGLVAWVVVAFAVAVVIGRGIRIADRRAGEGADLLTAGLGVDAVREPAVVRTPRRAIPLPPLGIALAALAVALETSGFVSRLNGARGTTAQLLSMDAPFSLPRMFVAALFAAAAFAAVAGAGALPGRRAWWLAVGLVAGVIAAVKAGSTVHAEALTSLSEAIGGSAAVAVSALVAAVVVGALWFLSRTERRDRRRVLSVLALYAVASVGLSAVSGAAGPFGSQWVATATFIEESGEALAAVAFLMAVLAGVAPRVVLPAGWALRREVDAQTLDLPEQVPGRSVIRGSRG
jgi:hypothetical protein